MLSDNAQICSLRHCTRKLFVQWWPKPDIILQENNLCNAVLYLPELTLHKAITCAMYSIYCSVEQIKGTEQFRLENI